MTYSYQKVNPKLTDHARTVLVLEGYSTCRSSDLPLFIKGIPALLCQIKNDSCRTTLFGQSVPDEKWMIKNDTTIIAFFFKPFALGAIFNLSAQVLKEKPIEINLWDAKKTMALNVQLLYAKSIKEKVEILNHFILTQIKANERECELIKYATDTLMQHPKADTLTQLLEELHIGERTFQRIFKKYVGTTPNQYRRICQFYFAFSQLKGGHFEKQTEVAYANDYFDQSHYIRSFKEFTHTTPMEYLQKGLVRKVQ